MRSREEILNRIYKACFIYPQIKEKLFFFFSYIEEILQSGEEKFIVTEILYCIDLWLDSYFSFLTF